MLIKVETGHKAYCIFDKIEFPHTFECISIPEHVYEVHFTSKDKNSASEEISDLTTYCDNYSDIKNIEFHQGRTTSSKFDLDSFNDLQVWYDSICMRHSINLLQDAAFSLNCNGISMVDASIHKFNRKENPTHANVVHFFREGQPFLVINVGTIYLCTDDGTTIDSLKL